MNSQIALACWTLMLAAGPAADELPPTRAASQSKSEPQAKSQGLATTKPHSHTGDATRPPLAIAPFNAIAAKRYQRCWAEHLGIEVVSVNSIGMKLVLIPPGDYLMGSAQSEIGARRCETPQHRVRLAKPFYLGVSEVTQGTYERVMGDNPSGLKGHGCLPVEQVSWHDATTFCQRLSAMRAEQKAGRAYRLPTEAEWEYACRAGSTTKYGFGNDEGQLADHAWYDTGAGTYPACRKRPNTWGLFDMHGNVEEWCQDSYDFDYRHSSANARQGPEDYLAFSRVVRGGSWHSLADSCRSARRGGSLSTSEWTETGFRVAVALARR